MSLRPLPRRRSEPRCWRRWRRSDGRGEARVAEALGAQRSEFERAESRVGGADERHGRRLGRTPGTEVRSRGRMASLETGRSFAAEPRLLDPRRELLIEKR